MLSVVVPVYNRAHLLPRTIASLLAQTQPAEEILVIDDGSTDGSAAAAEAFGPPVRVIRQHNQGPAAARNRGLDEARGDWVHFFDSDDLALPNLHAEQFRVLQATGADLAYAPWLKCAFTPQAIVPTHQVLQQRGLPRGDLVRALLSNWSVVPICCLIRTRLARQVGGFPVELQIGEDQLFFLNLLLAGAQPAHTPGTLVVYRADNPCKQSGGDWGRHLRDWSRFLLIARHHCLAAGIEPCRWFDFRLRIWDARVSLQTLADPCDLELIGALQTLEASHWPRCFYSMKRSLRRKGGGLSWRLYGRRAHRSFCAGPLTPSQSLALHSLKVFL